MPKSHNPATAAPAVVSPVVVQDSIENNNKVKISAGTSSTAAGIQHYDSAPDLRLMMENITERKKRKFEEKDSCLDDVIKEMFAIFTKDQATRFEELQLTIKSLKEQNNK
ncbi:hypothetical protein HF086_008309 [Spodoptera exigua]|uniref:Uncharacterized protein n=1 Tax=Spodoptera exigua TaxID=7107 RepID=A0A922SGI6_SPOEX|nr:hypothetical protein HF086_008309 [Spodoptera exigua]